MEKFDFVNRKARFPIVGKMQGTMKLKKSSKLEATMAREDTIGRDLMNRNTSSVVVDERFGKDPRDPDSFGPGDSFEEEDAASKKILGKLRHMKRSSIYDLDRDGMIDSSASLGGDMAIGDGDEFGDESFGGLEPVGDQAKKTSKEVYSEIIRKSKLGKLQRKAEKEEKDEETEKLDEEWKTIVSGSGFGDITRDPEYRAEKSERDDEYDGIYKSLLFDSVVTAARREFTPEEIAAQKLADFTKLEERKKEAMEETDLGAHEYDGDGVDELKRERRRLGLSILDPSALTVGELHDKLEIAKKRKGELSKEEMEEMIPRFFDSFMGSLDSHVAPEELGEGISTLFYVCQVSPQLVTALFRKRLSERYARMHEMMGKRGSSNSSSVGMSSVCAYEDLLMFKLLPIYFPVTDFSHNILTPSLLICNEMLTETGISSRKDLVTAFFLANIILSYIYPRKTFSPELYRFLYLMVCTLRRQVDVEGKELFSSVDSKVRDKKWLTQAKKPGKRQVEIHPVDINILRMEELDSGSKGNETIGNALRLSLINMLYSLLKRYLDCCAFLPNFNEIFQPLKSVLLPVDVAYLPQQLQSTHEKLIGRIDLLSKKSLGRTHLSKQEKPVEIKMMVPKFDESYSFDRKNRSVEEDELRKSKLEYKREHKGAMRELKKDMRFYHAKMNEERELSRSKKRKKYGEIIHMLEGEQSERKAINKRKKRVNK